jgi:hypothetical protein
MADTAAPAAGEPIVLTEEDHREVLECARYGELDDLKELLALGCDSNYKDGGGGTALHKAAANGFVEVAEALKAHGAVYCANESGNTPLHFAGLNGQKAMVEWLLAAYPDAADVYAKNGFGRSAFTEAISAGHEDIARAMLAHKSADPAAIKAKAVAAAAAGGDGAGGEGGPLDESEADVGDDDKDLVDEEAAKAAAAAGGEEGGEAASAGAAAAGAAGGGQ